MPDDPGTLVPLAALAVREVAERVGYTPRQVRALVRGRLFPEPLDIKLATQSWRWNPLDIDAYVRGEWKTDAA
jgi:predicted DNA-binding transcriptional regulator AlpA